MGEPRPSHQLGPKCDNERGIGVTDIPPGALLIVSLWGLLQIILFRDSTVFSSSPFRAPSSVGNMLPDRPVEGGTVGPGLPA